MTIVFFLARLSGDSVNLLLPDYATADERAALASQLHLNEPLIVQYGYFLRDAFRGNLGDSIFYQRSAVGVVLEHIGATLQLALAGIIVAIVVGILFGTWAAVREGSIFDNAVSALAVFGQSMPSFWLGMLLIIVFGVDLQILPTSGIGGFEYLILPATTVAAFLIPQILLLTRSSVAEVLRQPYIVVARSRGLPPRAVIYRHALRNAINPVVTSIGLQFGTLIGGSVITETLFSWPGVGRLSVQAISNRDIPLVEACVLVLALGVLLANLLADLVNQAVDPRSVNA